MRRLLENDNEDRGKNGPIRVSSGNYKDPLSSAFYQACIEAGAKANQDYNVKFDGVGWLQYSTKNGRRNSTSTGYLNTAKKNKNLKIEIKAEVEKILFEGKRAIGVQYRSHNILKIVKARAEVILAAGPMNSPKILELSGVGNAELLQHIMVIIIF